MYEYEKAQLSQQANGLGYSAQNAGLQAERQISVAGRTDRVLEQAANLRYGLSSLLLQLKQLPQNKDPEGKTPCRSGLDGKIQDASDHLSAAQNFAEELAQYLLS